MGGESTRAVRALGAAMAILAVAIPTAAGQDVTITPILRTGDPVPGVPGATVKATYSPVIDAAGNVAFEGTLEGPGIYGTNNGAIYRYTGAGPSILAREGDAAPGTPGYGYGAFLSVPSTGLPGQVAFQAYLDTGGLIADIVVDSSATPRLVAIESGPAPGIPGATYRWLPAGPLALGAGGDLAFAGYAEGDGVTDEDDQGVWADFNGTAQLLARGNQIAPGTGGALRLRNHYFHVESVSPTGAVNIYARMLGPGMPENGGSSFWAHDGDSLRKTAMYGDPAPGMPKNSTFVQMMELRTNRFDQVAFYGWAQGPEVDVLNDLGIWAGTVGDLHLVAREGDTPPGFADDYVFDDMGRVLMDETGQISFGSDLFGPGLDETNDGILWRGPIDDISVLLREDDHPAGTDPGVTFDFDIDLPSLTFNRRGDIALTGYIRGPGIDESNDSGLWIFDAMTDQWLLVAQEGMLLDGRVVTEVAFSYGGGGDGLRRTLSDVGLATFRVEFTDGGEGIYLGRFFFSAPGRYSPGAEGAANSDTHPSGLRTKTLDGLRRACFIPPESAATTPLWRPCIWRRRCPS
jgi:hypothetical protein